MSPWLQPTQPWRIAHSKRVASSPQLPQASTQWVTFCRVFSDTSWIQLQKVLNLLLHLSSIAWLRYGTHVHMQNVMTNHVPSEVQYPALHPMMQCTSKWIPWMEHVLEASIATQRCNLQTAKIELHIRGGRRKLHGKTKCKMKACSENAKSNTMR